MVIVELGVKEHNFIGRHFASCRSVERVSKRVDRSTKVTCVRSDQRASRDSLESAVSVDGNSPFTYHSQGKVELDDLGARAVRQRRICEHDRYIIVIGDIGVQDGQTSPINLHAGLSRIVDACASKWVSLPSRHVDVVIVLRCQVEPQSVFAVCVLAEIDRELAAVCSNVGREVNFLLEALVRVSIV